MFFFLLFYFISMLSNAFNILQETPESTCTSHSHKKHNLETRTKLAVPRTYVENQAITNHSSLFFGKEEPFFFTGHQNVHKLKSRPARTVYELIFLPFYKIIVSFFSFLCQDANKTRSNCAMIGCNLSKKHKVTLYKTQNRESNCVYHKFFFNFYKELPTCTKLWG